MSGWSLALHPFILLRRPQFYRGDEKKESIPLREVQIFPQKGGLVEDSYCIISMKTEGTSGGKTLIIASEPRVVVSIARSLHRKGIDCLLALPGSHDSWIRSRAICQVFRLPETPEEQLASLSGLIEGEHVSWIVPCSDSTLSLVARFYDNLSALAQVACPAPFILQRVLDKRQTLALAAECGIPIPESYFIPSMRELRECQSHLPFPLIAKLADKAAQTHHLFKVRRFPTLQSLVDCFDEHAEFGRNLIFQRFYEGNGVGVELLIHNGVVVARFQHRRIREFPATGGVAVLAESEPVDPILGEASERLLRALEWEGVAMVEFRHNPRDQKAVLMEINGRYWGTLPLALHAGVDFPYYHWQLAHDQIPSVPSNYKVGIRMRWAVGDFLRLYSLIRPEGGGATLSCSRRKALWDFLIDFHPRIHPAIWSLHDPMPALSEASRGVKRICKAEMKRLILALLPRTWIDTLGTAWRLGRVKGRRYLSLKIRRRLGILRYKIDHPEKISSVLFVCHGNIMRSPMAAAVLNRQLRILGARQIGICSAGIHAKEGMLIESNVRRIAQEMGIHLEDHTAQSVTEMLVDKADRIFVMDDQNFIDLVTDFPKARRKVRFLGGLTDQSRYLGLEIPDPYGTGPEEVLKTIQLVIDTATSLANVLASQTTSKGAKNNSHGSNPEQR